MKNTMLTNVRFNVLIIALIFPLISMAQFGLGTRGNGKVVTEERGSGNFNKIQLNGSADVYLTQGNENSITVKADENLLEQLETEISGDKLIIDVKGSISRYNALEVHVTVNDLQKIAVNGSGDFESKNTLKVKDFEISINGSGDIDLDLDVVNLTAGINGSGDVNITGVKGNLSIKIAGSGDFEGRGLELENCNISVYGSGDVQLNGNTTSVEIEQSASGDINLFNLTTAEVLARGSGSGDMLVNVTKSLKATLYGSGDITYRGNPDIVDVTAKGSGSVYKR
jgi:hypothetical protein